MWLPLSLDAPSARRPVTHVTHVTHLLRDGAVDDPRLHRGAERDRLLRVEQRTRAEPRHALDEPADCRHASGASNEQHLPRRHADAVVVVVVMVVVVLGGVGVVVVGIAVRCWQCCAVLVCR